MSKLVSKWMPRVIYICVYIPSSPPRPSSSPLNRLLRKRSSVPASCNSDSAGRNSRLPKFFRLLVREFLAQSCQAAVLMKRYRGWKPSRSPGRGFERRDIGEISPFEDFASCFPNSCAKIRQGGSFSRSGKFSEFG